MALQPSQLCFNTASLPGTDLHKLIDAGHAMGFEAVELLAFDGYRHRMGPLAGFYWDRMTASQRRELRRRLEGFRRIAIHAPFIDIHPIAPNPAIRETSVRQLEVAISAAAALGAEVVTTHAAGIPLFPYEEIEPELVALYRWLGDLADAAGVRVGIETGWPDPQRLARLAETVGHPAVGVTVDFGHLVATLPAEARNSPDGPRLYNDMLAQHIADVAERVVHVHIHDVRFPQWRDHARVGAGIIDFPRILGQLADIGYSGLLSFELEEATSDEALASSRDAVLSLMGGQ